MKARVLEHPRLCGGTDANNGETPGWNPQHVSVLRDQSLAHDEMLERRVASQSLFGVVALTPTARTRYGLRRLCPKGARPPEAIDFRLKQQP